MNHRARWMMTPVFMTATLTLTTPAALGQDSGESASSPASPASPSMIIDFRPNGQYLFGTPLDESNGDVSVWRGGFDCDFIFPREDGSRWIIGLDYEYNNYDFDPPNTMLPPFSDPFSEIHILDLDFTAYVPAHDGWSWFAGAFGQLAGEGNVDASDSAIIGGLGGFSKQINDDLRLGFGIRASTQIEDDLLILPVIDLDWKMNDRWSLRSIGPGIEAVCNLENGMELGLGARWESRRFRLDDDALTLASVVEDTSIPIFARLSHSPDERTRIELTGGYVFGREFRVEDRNGNSGTDYETDGAVFFGMSVRLRF